MRPRVQRAAAIVGGIDPVLTLAFLGLVFIGGLMVYSASIADAYTYYGSPYYVFEREVVWIVMGLIALTVTAHVYYRRWQQIALPLFAGACVLLLLVLVPHVGQMVNGARRWFYLGAGVEVEPSELLKFALVIYLARWLTSKGDRVRDFQACFVPFSLVVGAVFILIVKQPDLGTALVVGATAMAVYFIAGASITHIALSCSGAAFFAYVLMQQASYRSGRLTAFLDPWKDPTGVGYHTIQALLALGSGGILGKGLGNSIQKDVLPAPHTDSILAIIGEEFGLIGTLFVLALFVIIAYRGVRIAMRAPDNFGRLLAVGITSWITLQALMNFAVITSSVPFTGVPLPFVSYGGTSMIVGMAAFGILMNISRHATGEGFARAHLDNGRGHRRTRLPRVVGHPTPPGPNDDSAGDRSDSRPAGQGHVRSTRPRLVPLPEHGDALAQTHSSHRSPVQ